MKSFVDACIAATNEAGGKSCTLFIPPMLLATWKRAMDWPGDKPLDYHVPGGQVVRIRAAQGLIDEDGKHGHLIMRTDDEVLS